MKKLIYLLAFCGFLMHSIAQTNVSGGIYSNTTWTLSNSPYILTDTVVVFPNVVLTIEPGVEVRFDKEIRLLVRNATLIAKGTASNRIKFTSNSSSPAMGDWDGVVMYQTVPDTTRFSYCDFYYAKHGITSEFSMDANWVSVDRCTFESNKFGVQAASGNRYLIKNSNFKNNNVGITYVNAGHTPGIIVDSNLIDSNNDFGISLYSGPNVVTNNTITNNDVGLYDSWVSGRFYENNLIENNVIGIKAGEYDKVTDTIRCNHICNNSSYNFYYTSQSGGSLNISNNYWCSKDSTTVANTIFDGYDDFNYDLTVFMPLDTGSCVLTKPTGMDERDLVKKEFHIYPNPTKGLIKLEFNSSSNGRISIYNILGSEVHAFNFSDEMSIDIHLPDHLENGVYFVNYFGEESVMSKRVVLSR